MLSDKKTLPLSMKDEKILKDNKQVPKKPIILSISDAILGIKKFADDKVTQEPVKLLIEKLNKFDHAMLLFSVLDSDERIHIEMELQAIINFINKEFKKWLNDKRLSIKIQNKTFGDVLYDVFLAIAKNYPINSNDPISQSPIPKENALYTSDRYRFDINNLVSWIKSRKKYINPFTNVEFNKRDIKTIIEFARYKNYFLSYPFKNQIRAPEEPTQLDLDAMSASHVESQQIMYVSPLERLALFVRRSNLHISSEIKQIDRPASILLSINEKLNEAKILNDNSRNLVTPYAQNVQILREINLSLQNLNIARILNQANFICIMNKPCQSNWIAVSLVCLNRGGILNDSNRALLQQHSNRARELSLRIQHCDEPLNQQIFLNILQTYRRNNRIGRCTIM